MTSLMLAALFFVVIHIGVAGTTLRDRITGAIGQRAYMAVFSIASAAGLIWLIMGYRAAPYLATWGMLEWWKPVAIALMFLSVLLVVLGLTSPNPTTVAQEERITKPPEGIVRVTRHPFLVGVALWAIIHVIGNGDWASLVLFGAFAIVALVGTVSIDGKRRRLLGEAAWQGFAEHTSIVPFAAIAAGRNSFDAGEIGLWRPIVAIVVYALILGGHSHLFGVSPFP